MLTNNDTDHARQTRALFRLQRVQALTGLSRSGIYGLMAKGHFPASISLTGGRSVCWDSHAVEAWIESRIAAAAAAA